MKKKWILGLIAIVSAAAFALCGCAVNPVRVQRLNVEAVYDTFVGCRIVSKEGKMCILNEKNKVVGEPHHKIRRLAAEQERVGEADPKAYFEYSDGDGLGVIDQGGNIVIDAASEQIKIEETYLPDYSIPGFIVTLDNGTTRYAAADGTAPVAMGMVTDNARRSFIETKTVGGKTEYCLRDAAGRAVDSSNSVITRGALSHYAVRAESGRYDYYDYAAKPVASDVTEKTEEGDFVLYTSADGTKVLAIANQKNETEKLTFSGGTVEFGEYAAIYTDAGTEKKTVCVVDGDGHLSRLATDADGAAADGDRLTVVKGTTTTVYVPSDGLFTLGTAHTRVPKVAATAEDGAAFFSTGIPDCVYREIQNGGHRDMVFYRDNEKVSTLFSIDTFDDVDVVFDGALATYKKGEKNYFFNTLSAGGYTQEYVGNDVNPDNVLTVADGATRKYYFATDALLACAAELGDLPFIASDDSGGDAAVTVCAKSNGKDAFSATREVGYDFEKLTPINDRYTLENFNVTINGHLDRVYLTAGTKDGVFPYLADKSLASEEFYANTRLAYIGNVRITPTADSRHIIGFTFGVQKGADRITAVFSGSDFYGGEFDGYAGIWNAESKPVAAPVFSEAIQVGEDTAVVKKGDHYALLKMNGEKRDKRLTDYEYADYEVTDDIVIMTRYDGIKDVFDRNGKKLVRSVVTIRAYRESTYFRPNDLKEFYREIKSGKRTVVYTSYYMVDSRDTNFILDFTADKNNIDELIGKFAV